MTSHPVRSTWPEASYALTLTKSGTWPAQRRIVELFCAHAWAQGVFIGPVDASHRDVASHLYRTPDAGVNSAGAALRALVDRGVLRCIGVGTGTAPSEWDVAHWTHWDVPWIVHKASVVDRMAAFVAGEIRAQEPISARVMVRALAKSARAFSQELSDRASASARVMDSRASAPTLFSEPQVSDSRLARKDPAHTVLLVREESLSLEGGREIEQARKEAPAEFVQAFCRGSGAGWLVKRYKCDLGDLVELAGEERNRWLLGLCADKTGPNGIEERLAWLRSNLEAPASVSPRRIGRDRATQIRIELRAYEGELDKFQAAERDVLLQELATLEQPQVTMAV